MMPSNAWDVAVLLSSQDGSCLPSYFRVQNSDEAGFGWSHVQSSLLEILVCVLHQQIMNRTFMLQFIELLKRHDVFSFHLY